MWFCTDCLAGNCGACLECGPRLDDGTTCECEHDDREFEARTILTLQHGVYLDLRDFTLEQIEALAEVVKTWED